MEPATALASIITVGLNVGKAWKEDGVGTDELEALIAMLESASHLRTMSEAPADVEALHLALITGAFGVALRQHWSGWKRYIPTGRNWFSRENRERKNEIYSRMQVVTQELRVLGAGDQADEIEHVTALIGRPTVTPYFQSIWNAFTMDGNLLVGTRTDIEPLVRKEHPSEIRSFQHRFLLAYWHGLATTSGQQVANYLQTLEQYRALLMREMFLDYMAGWGTHHVFGNVPRDEEEDYYGLPFMPLDDAYVEPNACMDDELPRPILKLLLDALDEEQPRILIVRAPFGMGKSLTTRKLVKELALKIQNHPDRDHWFPVLIKCARDFPKDVPTLSQSVQSANHNWAEKLGVNDFKRESSIFQPPEVDRPTLFILDGLDEVALDGRQLDILFENLRGEMTSTHRIVVFTRPSALTSKPSDDICHTIDIKPFTREQIEQWLAKWNGLPQPQESALSLSSNMIEERGLLELASTPILLLMIAATWRKDDEAGSTPGARALLYERFFQQIAAGKSRYDKEKYQSVWDASDILLNKLSKLKILEHDTTHVDAMLWLMGRLAWEQNCLQQTKGVEQLERRHVSTLVHDELQLYGDNEILETVRVALLTVMQADFTAGADRFLFGHKSFREFLEARFWSQRLKRILRAGRHEMDKLIQLLFRGRLLQRDSASFSLLLDIMRLPESSDRIGWTDNARAKLMRWCEEEFEDARIIPSTDKAGAPPSLSNDIRLPMRETALGLRCVLGEKGYVGGSPALRTLMAGFWAIGESVTLVAESAHLQGAHLQGAHLQRANLQRANLQRANLQRANLQRANLYGANLQRAHLYGANLQRAHLYGAHLEGANLQRANLYGARLYGADLYGAHLEGAHLEGANLEGANLEGAHLERANLERANLERANLEGAHLEGANLEGANLEGAHLEGANLEGANLEGANLEGADLQRANLEGTNLTTHQLRQTKYDEYTILPKHLLQV